MTLHQVSIVPEGNKKYWNLTPSVWQPGAISDPLT